MHINYLYKSWYIDRACGYQGSYIVYVTVRSASVNNMLKSDRAFLSSVSPHIMPCKSLVLILLLYLLCLLGGLKVSVVSSVVFIPSLLSDDVSQVGLLQLEELTRLQWSSNESLARNLQTKSGRCYNYRSRYHYIPLQETYMFMYMYMYICS